MSDDFTPRAIPTEYNGIKFKSRLESTVAWLLDAMGAEWQYEPKSFLLPNGVQYMPDFWCPGMRLWIETRGYDSPKGRKQILGFCDHLYGSMPWYGHLEEDGEPDPSICYMIVGPHGIGWSGVEIRGYPLWHDRVHVYRCPRAGLVFIPRYAYESPYCHYCHRGLSDGNAGRLSIYYHKGIIEVRTGVENLTIPDDSLVDTIRSLREHEVYYYNG